MMIDEHNYESYLLDYVDGELPEAEQKLLLQYMAAHPELEEELQLLQKTKLESPEAIAFPGKELLYRSEADLKKAIIFSWKKVAVAVAAAACLFLVFHIYFSPEEQVSNTQKIAATTADQPASSSKTMAPEPKSKLAKPANEKTGKKVEEGHNKNALLAAKTEKNHSFTPEIKKQNATSGDRKNSSAPTQRVDIQSASLAKIDVKPIQPRRDQQDFVPEVQARQFATLDEPEVAIENAISASQEESIAANNAGGTVTITSTLQKLSDQKRSLDSSFTDKMFALQQKVAHPIQLLHIQKIKIGNVSFVFNKK